MMEYGKNNGTEEIGLVIPTPARVETGAGAERIWPFLVSIIQTMSYIHFYKHCNIAEWRHDADTPFVLLDICGAKPSGMGGFPSQKGINEAVGDFRHNHVHVIYFGVVFGWRLRPPTIVRRDWCGGPQYTLLHSHRLLVVGWQWGWKCVLKRCL